MLEAICEFLLEIICVATGEVILWVVTVGRRKPFEIKNAVDGSTLIGLFFWVLIAGVVAMVFLLERGNRQEPIQAPGTFSWKTRDC